MRVLLSDIFFGGGGGLEIFSEVKFFAFCRKYRFDKVEKFICKFFRKFLVRFNWSQSTMLIMK